MPKNCIKFISGFLIPSLNEEKFGERLKWINKSEKKFQIIWNHKGGPKWTEQEAEVFAEWDKHKGHFQPNELGYFTQSKQRFRSMLYKLTRDGELIKEKSEKYKKCYSIGKKRQRKRQTSRKSDVEIETFNEDFIDSAIIDDIGDDVHMEKGNVGNVLEDHAYSTSTNSLQNKAPGKIDDYFETLAAWNKLDDDCGGFIVNNVNLSDRAEDVCPFQNLDMENTEIPKISENDPDYTSFEQYKFGDYKSISDGLLSTVSSLPYNVVDWSSDLNLNKRIFLLLNEVAK